eukprot:TRINITY_DN94798_c0_g1_i1.p1 TRINITY_DN94798_c0_g1~~TRINITY_DN94798_c0_g1_i1.p1  ORF type:complete len:425 (-),score=63.77 TRINITY_DN94798_c0_g1_i1:462-1736(-)
MRRLSECFFYSVFLQIALSSWKCRGFEDPDESFRAQEWTYNASLWYGGNFLDDKVHGPALIEFADVITEVTYGMMDILNAVCVKKEGDEHTVATTCPMTGMCDMKIMTAAVAALVASTAQNSSVSLNKMTDQTLRGLATILINRLLDFARIPGCEELGEVMSSRVTCSPIIFEYLSCARGVSDLFRTSMAEIYVRAVALFSERDERIGISQPDSTYFDAEHGSERSQILISLLKEIRAERIEEAKEDGKGDSSDGAHAGIKILVAEVGVHNGKNSEALLKALPELELLLIDPWEYASDEYLSGKEIRSLYRESKEASTMSDSVWQRLREYRNRSIIIAQKSPEAAFWARGQSLDLVFIDGCHSYSSVRDDIEAWTPKLKRGGILAGHDYGLFFPGVCRAVHEFAHQTQGALTLAADGVWWFKLA